MASLSIEACGLASVQIRPVPGDEDAVALVLTDEKGATSGYLINAEGLGVILAPLLGLAAKWAEKPDLGLENVTGPKNALPATRIILGKGRNDQEASLRVFVGKMDLSFLIPLDDLISGMSQLVQKIDPNSGAPPH